MFALEDGIGLSQTPKSGVMTTQITNRFIRIVAIAVLVPILASCATKPRTVLWDSSELQTQIDKKKLVMRFWSDYLRRSDGKYDWAIKYRIRAENRGGTGWHTVPELYSVSYKVLIELPQGTSTISGSPNVDGAKSNENEFYYLNTTLPTFKSKTITGVRYGGPSGISRTWP